MRIVEFDATANIVDYFSPLHSEEVVNLSLVKTEGPFDRIEDAELETRKSHREPEFKFQNPLLVGEFTLMSIVQ